MRRRRLLLGCVAFGGMAVTGLARAQYSFGTFGVRQDVATLPPDRLAALEAAIGEMQRRSQADPDDPAGWRANTLAHTLACSSAGEPWVHGNWWFLPWHRAFLAVTELKLQALSGDHTLRLPYWNWSSDRQIPAAFSRPGSPLSRARRFTPDRPLRAAEVDYQPHDPAAAKLGVAALGASTFQPSSQAAIPQAFGGVADPHPSGWRGRSRLEGVPHAAIHNYVGGEAPDGALGDMMELATAALDPIFLAHHANLDRLWESWRSDPRRRATEPDEAAFRDRQFVFPWLDGTPIAIEVGDVLRTAHFDYAYDRLPALRDGPAPAADEPEAPLLLARTTVPAPRLREGGRAILTISGLTAGDRPLTAEVTLAPTGDPASAVIVGALAMGRRHGAPFYPDTEWHFDVTEALRGKRLESVEISVNALALGRELFAPPFVYAAMQIVVI